MFLVSLAVADLLLLVVCAPLETLQYFLLSWESSAFVCHFTTYVKMLSAVASVLNLTAVSLERYIVIVYPMKSRVLCTLSNCRRALVFVWVVAVVLTMPLTVTKASDAVVYYNNETNVTVYYCWDKKTSSDVSADTDGLHSLPIILSYYQFAIMFAIPLALMSFCYARVIAELWLSTKTMTAMTRISRFDSRSSISTTNLRHQVSGIKVGDAQLATRKSKSGVVTMATHEDIRQARKQVIKMLLLVILLFLVCWGPHLIMNIMIKRGLSNFSHVEYKLRITFSLLPFIHSCFNPFVYTFMSTNFRHIMTKGCTKNRHKKFSLIPACCNVGNMNRSACGGKRSSPPEFSRGNSALALRSTGGSQRKASSQPLVPLATIRFTNKREENNHASPTTETENITLGS